MQESSGSHSEGTVFFIIVLAMERQLSGKVRHVMRQPKRAFALACVFALDLFHWPRPLLTGTCCALAGGCLAVRELRRVFSLTIQ